MREPSIFDHRARQPRLLDTGDLESRIEAARNRIVAAVPDTHCSSCHGGHIVCAFHPDQPLGHGGCEDFGMPCLNCAPKKKK
jgi:hypothetical protein